jgi:hypothetical protein
LLQKLIAFFSGKVITTPNILTEVSNLSRKIPGSRGQEYFERFNACIQLFDEQYHPSKDCSNHAKFFEFGLTDISVLRIAGKGVLVLTDDFPLAMKLESSKIDVLNFNHVRNIEWEPMI